MQTSHSQLIGQNILRLETFHLCPVYLQFNRATKKKGGERRGKEGKERGKTGGKEGEKEGERKGKRRGERKGKGRGQEGERRGKGGEKHRFPKFLVPSWFGGKFQLCQLIKPLK